MTNIILRETRKSMGLRQADLAAASGVSRVTICKLENGSATGVSLKTMTKIADALNADVGYLFFSR